jgi:chemotaxis signal transduction protein
MNMTASITKENIETEERYLVAVVGERKIAFLARWVQEILLIPRSQVLELPFYDPCLLGVVHYQGQIVPLVSGQNIFLQKIQPKSQATLSVVCLNQFGQNLTGVGVVVDRMVENLSSKDIADNISTSESKSQFTEFQFRDIPQHIWQPKN